jgi:uncharacterized protein
VIGAVAFCPHPPALLPDVGRAGADELTDVRDACRRAIRTVVTPPRSVVLIGSGAESHTYPATAQGSLGAYGVPVEAALGPQGTGPMHLPLSLTIGAWLIHDALGDRAEAVGFAVGRGWDGSPAASEFAVACRGDAEIALLVLGDGSGWRDAVTPDRLGERAAAFDAAVAAALAAGDVTQLLVDAEEAEVLMVGGASAWRVIARDLDGRRWSPRLDVDVAPFGVGYFVATWT